MLALSVAACLGAGLAAGGCITPGSSLSAQGPDDPPRLAVLLVVDQLSADLFERYDDVFEGGFRRLLDRGRVFSAATHDHAITETAPGHATLGTGTHPSRHGVVANQWWERVDGGWETVFNVLDPTTHVLGAPGLAGSSPRVLRREALGDWMVRADPDSRVVALSAKDRAAILLAGQGRHRVFWLDSELGRWVSSSWYADALPRWVSDFNDGDLPGLRADSVWTSAVPAALAGRSRPDSAAYENDGVHTAFPHTWAEQHAADTTLSFDLWWAGIPGPDLATLRLARVAVEAEGLGDDEVPDLLAVSLSQTDRIGHPYGPDSREQLDNLLRLDAALGEFLSWLDDRLGPDAYVVALTADHGVMPVPEALAAEGLPARRLEETDRDELQRALDAAFGWARRAGATEESLADTLAGRVRALSWVGDAWSDAELARARDQASDSFTTLQARSTFPGRVTGLLGRAGVVYRTVPDVISWSLTHGTTHGSPYLYDRRVPLVLMGRGIEPGRVAEPVSTADLAPTLARLLGVDVPGDLDGVARPVN
jgi:predicted AlkP superfamily pyrophosphatase or phosphodiesterase